MRCATTYMQKGGLIKALTYVLSCCFDVVI